MIPPDFRNCTEKELWQYVASGDLDLVLDRHERQKADATLKSLGFIPDKSRYYKHPQCSHLYLEFPKGPVELVEEYPVTPEEVIVEGRTLRILSPTDCVKDRLAGYIHWKTRSGFNQAILVRRRQPDRVDLNRVAAWCEHEGSAGGQAFKELRDRLSEIEFPQSTSP